MLSPTFTGEQCHCHGNDHVIVTVQTLAKNGTGGRNGTTSRMEPPACTMVSARVKHNIIQGHDVSPVITIMLNADVRCDYDACAGESAGWAGGYAVLHEKQQADTQPRDRHALPTGGAAADLALTSKLGDSDSLPKSIVILWASFGCRCDPSECSLGTPGSD